VGHLELTDLRAEAEAGAGNLPLKWPPANPAALKAGRGLLQSKELPTPSKGFWKRPQYSGKTQLSEIGRRATP
jgi:hypothetical protein